MGVLNTDKISPIFITGTYRSGSTLTARLLDNHSELSVWADTVHFFRYCYQRYDPISDFSNVEKLVGDVADRLRLRFGMEAPVSEILNTLHETETTYASVYNAIYSSSYFLDGKKRWGEKTVLAWTRTEDFLKMFPSGKVILTVRDPRAVLVSWKRETIARKPLYMDAVFNCLGALQEGRRLKATLDKNSFYILKLEETLSNPEATVKLLCKFLDVDFEAGILDTSKFSDTKTVKARTNPTFSERNRNCRGFIIDTIKSWKAQINKEELLICNRILSEELTSYGYQEMCDDKATDGLLERYFSRTDDYLFRHYIEWKETGLGHEGYPTDPTNPHNWDPKSSKWELRK
ncbi:MAG: sulfotransferase [Deltaproteobacteria bacterium]|nr:sulfotransferase [Deltaproteobacteria bacterium]